jgi:uncharacterized protein YqfA (UPF0365 family)
MEIFVVFGGFIGLMFFMMFFPVGLWVSAMLSGVPVSPFTLIAMRFRGVDQSTVVQPLIQGVKAGLEGLELAKLEAHYMANGSVPNVVNALVSAQKAHIPLNFDQAAAIDLAGRDVLAAVTMSVNPRVIKTPMISAMCKDGIQVKATARITVRAKLDKLVGGAGEETILARVGEGICTTIGSALTHAVILENPDHISARILEKGLDKGTAFEIVSIDIADVDVGKNIGAELSIERAEADKRIANAKAAERQAMAQAKTQEMIAYEQEMKAKVVEAQAQVPLALAEALRTGKLAPMDYYKLKNLEADTSMRESFGSGK